MTDIIAKLTELADEDNHLTDYYRTAYQEAIDEIERLQADRDEWKQCCEVEAGLRREFNDEAERLRAALTRIAAGNAAISDKKIAFDALNQQIGDTK